MGDAEAGRACVGDGRRFAPTQASTPGVVAAPSRQPRSRPQPPSGPPVVDGRGTPAGGAPRAPLIARSERHGVGWGVLRPDCSTAPGPGAATVAAQHCGRVRERADGRGDCSWGARSRVPQRLLRSQKQRERRPVFGRWPTGAEGQTAVSATAHTARGSFHGSAAQRPPSAPFLRRHRSGVASASRRIIAHALRTSRSTRQPPRVLREVGAERVEWALPAVSRPRAKR